MRANYVLNNMPNDSTQTFELINMTESSTRRLGQVMNLSILGRRGYLLGPPFQGYILLVSLLNLDKL